MSPEVPAFQAYQAAFAARIRNPAGAPRPPGAPARRMKVYQDLLFNNLEGFLLACYPITRQLLGARAWKRTLRAYFAGHRAHSPLFRDIPREFLDWIEPRAGDLFPDMPYLAEFMHYEWLELAVLIDPEEADPAAIDPDGDPLEGRPSLQPAHRIASYRYPVHRIGPRYRPAAPEPQGYVLYRDAADEVRFERLNPLTARLLEILDQERPSGRQALARLAQESGLAPETLFPAGAALLRDMREKGLLLGNWRTP